MSLILGIDLAAANACAAVFDGGTVQIIPKAEGVRFTSSVYAVQPWDGAWLVGHIAPSETGPDREPASPASGIAHMFWEQAT